VLFWKIPLDRNDLRICFPLAWLLAQPFGLGALGIFIAVPVSFAALTIWSAVLFRRGRWKERKV